MSSDLRSPNPAKASNALAGSSHTPLGVAAKPVSQASLQTLVSDLKADLLAVEVLIKTGEDWRADYAEAARRLTQRLEEWRAVALVYPQGDCPKLVSELEVLRDMLVIPEGEIPHEERLRDLYDKHARVVSRILDGKNLF